MVLVTGATGFLGEHVVRKLVARRVPLACLARPTSNIEPLRKKGLAVRLADLGDVDGLVAAMHGVDTIVNLASLGFGHAPQIIAACGRAGVRRGVFISTTAIFTTLEPRTKQIRIEAERCIQASNLNWTILRPTMIYGTERDRNMARLVRYLARYPVIPVLGPGTHSQQPVHVDDLADAVLAALDEPRSVGNAYDISGKTALTYNQVVDLTAAALQRRVGKIHVPLSLALGALALYERTVRRPVLKAEQVLRLNEDKAFIHEDAARDLGYAPRSFADGIKDEVTVMRHRGLIK